MLCRLCPPLVALILFASYTASAALGVENWPQWRGPNADGIASDAEYPTEFSNDESVAWNVALPGPGSSTPAVWEDQIFVTCGIDGRDGLVCYDFNGRELWRKTLGAEQQGKHRYGSGSNPSPVTDGEHLVVYYKSGTVACYDLAGNEKWQVNLDETYGKMDLWWDMGNSPVLAGDRVIIARMHAGDSYLVALDLASGNVIWKQPRQYKVPVECDQAYTTPHIVTIGDRELVVTWGADHLTGHDVATGEMVFESGGFNPKNEGMWRVIASAAVGQGVAIVPHGRGNLLAAVALDGEGVVTESHRLWTKQIDGPDVPTPVITGDRVVVLGDSGDLTCLNIRSGEVQWSAKIPGNRRTKFYASPVLAGDTLFCAREDGKIYVGRVSDDGYTQLAENDMNETLIATPVPIRGGLLVRGAEHLFFVTSQVAASGG